MEVINGELVRLRPITKDDTNLIVKWRNTSFVRNNFIFQEDFTQDMHNKWLKDKVETGEVVQYIIEDSESNTPIGSVYFRDIDYKTLSAEYGIFIGEKQYTGRGYGSETARLFTQYGIQKMKLVKIILRVFENNIGAIKSYRNAGYRTYDHVEIEQNGKKKAMLMMAIER